MSSKAMQTRMAELSDGRVAFVHATVVRAQAPTSSHAGAQAIVLGDGALEGFVGGQCAENSVRTAALRALDDHQPLLLRILPEDDTTQFPDTPGAEVVINPCLSGGALEIFLEPVLPATVLTVVGETPIAAALGAIGAILGYEISTADASNDFALAPSSAGVIIASHGRHEAETIRSALDAGVGYIALVASTRRGAAVLSEAGVTTEEMSRVQTPAGLQIGAGTAAEVALSILAEFVQIGHSHPLDPEPADAQRPAQAIDPVCGMTVTIMGDTPHLSIDGKDYWFCNPGCRERFAAEQERVGAR